MVGWPSQPNTEGLGHKPGSSVVASGGNPDKVDGVRDQQEHLPLDAFWGRGHGIVLRVPEGLTPHLGNLKRGTNLMGQPLGVTHIGDGD